MHAGHPAREHGAHHAALHHAARQQHPCTEARVSRGQAAAAGQGTHGPTLGAGVTAQQSPVAARRGTKARVATRKVQISEGTQVGRINNSHEKSHFQNTRRYVIIVSAVMHVQCDPRRLLVVSSQRLLTLLHAHCKRQNYCT